MTNHERPDEKFEGHKHKLDQSSEHLSRFANSLSSEKSKKEVTPPGLLKLDLVDSSKRDKNSGATRTVFADGKEVTEYPGGGKTSKTIDKDGISTLVVESTGRPVRVVQIEKDGSVKSYSDGSGNIYTSSMVADDKDVTKQKRAWTISTKEGEQHSFDGTIRADNSGNVIIRDEAKTGGDYAERRLNNGTIIRSDKDNLVRTLETATGLTIQSQSEFKTQTFYCESGPAREQTKIVVEDNQPTLVSKTLTYPENGGSMVLQYNSDGTISGATRIVDGVAENMTGLVRESNGQVEITNREGQFIIATSGKMIKVDPLEKQYEPEFFGESPDPEASALIQEVPTKADLDANIKEAESYQTKNLSVIPYGAQEMQKYAWFYNKVKPGADWDYKVNGMQYEDFGNFNYGVTAAASGIPLEVALKEAGRVQTVRKKEWGEPGDYISKAGTGSYGDDPRDQLKIREGYERYLKLKAEREQQAQKAA